MVPGLWLTTTDPWGVVTYVNLADVMACGTREQDGQAFGVLWMRNSAIMFWCSLAEFAAARQALGLVTRDG
jgi:hypothetical protein